MTSDSILSQSLEENHWVLQISQLLRRTDFPKAFNSPPFIFRLPDSVHDQNPDLYLPRRIALGPYHHFRPELYNMELYKLKAANEVRNDLQLTELVQLADRLLRLDLRIRACFDKHLEMGDQTLASILMVDGMFLLRLIAKFLPERERNNAFPNFDDQNLFHSEHERLVAHYEILSDIIKLENQIPFLVLKEILPSDLSAKLPFILYSFCLGISPFKLPPASMIVPDFPRTLKNSHHLLHFIYYTIVFMPTYFSPEDREFGTGSEMSETVTIFQKLLSIASSVVNIVFLQQLNGAIDLIRRLFEVLGMVGSKEISRRVLPSASQLQKVDVKFCESENGIMEAGFRKDPDTPRSPITLMLPVISVNAFTEVLLRNLVAFEAMAGIQPAWFAGYVDLMNELIASSKDVKVLKEAKLLFSEDVESDEEIVKLFNGVRASISGFFELNLKKIHYLGEGDYEKVKKGYEPGMEEMAEKINEYYEGFWRVKAEKFVRKYVGSAVVIMAVSAIVFLMFLEITWLVCNMLLSCPKILKNSVAATDALNMF